MRLRWHLLILSLIAILTVILFPMPFFLYIFVIAGEGLLYGWWIMPGTTTRNLQNKRRRHLD